MLPPDLAAFTFSLDRAGTDPAIAARAASTIGKGRILVVGAQRWGLLTALAERGVYVTAFDAARSALSAARATVDRAGLGDRVTLYAADARDFDVPGGCDAAVVPSSAWRPLTHAASRAAMLACLRRALGERGTLFMDVDCVPAEVPQADTALRDGPGRQSWTWRRGSANSTLIVTCAADGVAPRSIEVHDLSPEATAGELTAARFDVVSVTNASNRAPYSAASRRAWIVARPSVAAE